MEKRKSVKTEMETLPDGASLLTLEPLRPKPGHSLNAFPGHGNDTISALCIIREQVFVVMRNGKEQSVRK